MAHSAAPTISIFTKMRHIFGAFTSDFTGTSQYFRMYFTISFNIEPHCRCRNVLKAIKICRIRIFEFVRKWIVKISSNWYSVYEMYDVFWFSWNKRTFAWQTKIAQSTCHMKCLLTRTCRPIQVRSRSTYPFPFHFFN